MQTFVVYVIDIYIVLGTFHEISAPFVRYDTSTLFHHSHTHPCALHFINFSTIDYVRCKKQKYSQRMHKVGFEFSYSQIYTILRRRFEKYLSLKEQ